jgi:ppGpp synthetase/RelA/SpoT-type nucleotidyltranferase
MSNLLLKSLFPVFISPVLIALAQAQHPVATLCSPNDLAIETYRNLSASKRTEILNTYRHDFSDALSEAEERLQPKVENTPVLIETRLKTLESLKEKILRPGKNYSCLSEITDIAGIRLIIPDYATLPWIHDLIKTNFTVLSEENLLSNQRESGYRAVHYLISIDNRIAEIQIHTLRGLLWADVSHKLFYKGPYSENAEMDDFLTQLSDAIYLLDSGLAAEIPDPPSSLPEQAINALEQAVSQIRKVGHPGPDTHFIIIEHNEEESGHESLHLRLTIPFISPSDYFSLDEFRKIGFQIRSQEN